MLLWSSASAPPQRAQEGLQGLEYLKQYHIVFIEGRRALAQYNPEHVGCVLS